MASVRERKWGRGKSAYVVDYFDIDGKRRLQTFKSRKAAEVFKTAMEFALRVEAEDVPQEKPAPAPEPSKPPLAEEILWGAQKVADALNIGQRQAYYLLEQGYIPAKKVGAQWVCTKSALQKAISV